MSAANAVTADRGSMVIIMQTATNKLIKRLGLIIFYSFSMIFQKTLSVSVKTKERRTGQTAGTTL
ncbi:hypothetical protein [Faecalibacterium prausnitzii]|uniref:hypothetical protein n=1 Tax=Faecalibacterium prausnitzii TaxID=853 RepID=UPI0018E07F24|nr:hypothetical protein [Faecalibacterium prausnitzii]